MLMEYRQRREGKRMSSSPSGSTVPMEGKKTEKEKEAETNSGSYNI